MLYNKERWLDVDKDDVTLEELKLAAFNIIFTILQHELSKSQSFSEAKKTVTNYLEDIIETINAQDKTPER